MNSQLALFNLGGGEIILILALILILFGARNLDKIAKGLGDYLGELKRVTRDGAQEMTAASDTGNSERNQLIVDGITVLLVILLGFAVLSYLTAIL